MSVTKLSFPYGESIKWIAATTPISLPDSPFKEWLLSTDSLTKKLKNQCDAFEVRVLGEGSFPPLTGELPTQPSVWVREVLLCLDGTPWVFARTLIPSRLLEKKMADFLGLGTRPLGEILYSQSEFTPEHIEVAHFTACTRVAQLAKSLNQNVTTPLWGRRRYFSCLSEQLIVSEIFLPAAQQYLLQPEPA